MQLPKRTVAIVSCDSLVALTVAVGDPVGASISSPPALSTWAGRVQFPRSYSTGAVMRGKPGPCETMGCVDSPFVHVRSSWLVVLTSFAEVSATKLQTIFFAVVPAGLVTSCAEAVPADRAIKEAAATATRLKIFRFFTCSSLFRCSSTGFYSELLSYQKGST